MPWLILAFVTFFQQHRPRMMDDVLSVSSSRSSDEDWEDLLLQRQRKRQKCDDTDDRTTWPKIPEPEFPPSWKLNPGKTPGPQTPMTPMFVAPGKTPLTPMFVEPSQAPGKPRLVLKPSKSVKQPPSVTVEIANVSPLGAIKVTGHIKWEGMPGSFSMLVPGMQVIEVKEKGAPSGIYAWLAWLWKATFATCIWDAKVVPSNNSLAEPFLNANDVPKFRF